MELHFGSLTYENHQVQLFKLRQTSFVFDYHTVFKKLCNMVYGLPIDVLLNCFLSGLHVDIRRELAILCLVLYLKLLALLSSLNIKLRTPDQNLFTLTSTHPHPTPLN